MNEEGRILCIVIAYQIWRLRLKVGTFFNWVGQASLGWSLSAGLGHGNDLLNFTHQEGSHAHMEEGKGAKVVL